eukprot:COSAG01_NODE_7422_length_3214_cov_3.664526_1_plen_835_part_10
MMPPLPAGILPASMPPLPAGILPATRSSPPPKIPRAMAEAVREQQRVESTSHAEFRTEGHPWLGQRFARSYMSEDGTTRSIHATVVSWAAADGEDEALWHVRHADGDEEDLDEAEMRKALFQGGGGSVPIGEAEGTSHATPSGRNRLTFEQVDTDGDGVISRAEWEAAAAASSDGALTPLPLRQPQIPATAQKATAKLAAELLERAAEPRGQDAEAETLEVHDAVVAALTSFVDADLLAKAGEMKPTTVMSFVREAVAAQEKIRARSNVEPLMRPSADGVVPPAPENYKAGGLREATTAGNLTITSTLLTAGVNPNATVEKFADWSPLHYGAQRGHSQVVVALLEAKADPLAVDKEGETPLMQACYWGNRDAVPELVQKMTELLLVDGADAKLPPALAAKCAEQEEKYGFTMEEVLMPPAVVWSEARPRLTEYSQGFLSILCSAPEFSLPMEGPTPVDTTYVKHVRWGPEEAAWKADKWSVEVMVGLFKLCEDLNDFVKFGYDWGGSSTAEPSDLNPERLVPACCESLACSCGGSRSSRMIKGPVKWWDAKSVAGSMWFPKYRTKVMGAIQAEAQRPGIKYIEMVVIAGGPVSQLERRTMPCIVSGSVADLRHKGVNIVLAGSPDFDADCQEQIVVFVRTMEYHEFFDRFTDEKVEELHSRDFLAAVKEFPVEVNRADEVLDASGQSEKITSAELKMLAVFVPMMPQLHSLNLSGCGVGPKEAGWLAAAIKFMAALARVSVLSNPIGADGADALIEVFNQNTKLRTLLGIEEGVTELNLSKKSVDPGQAKILAAELKASRAVAVVKKVVLSHNFLFGSEIKYGETRHTADDDQSG